MPRPPHAGARASDVAPLFPFRQSFIPCNSCLSPTGPSSSHRSDGEIAFHFSPFYKRSYFFAHCTLSFVCFHALLFMRFPSFLKPTLPPLRGYSPSSFSCLSYPAVFSRLSPSPRVIGCFPSSLVPLCLPPHFSFYQSFFFLRTIYSLVSLFPSSSRLSSTPPCLFLPYPFSFPEPGLIRL